MKRLYILLLTLVALLDVAAHKIYVYRNDGRFNQLSADGSAELLHEVNNTDTIVKFGNESLSLSAIDSISVRSVDVPVLHFTFPDNPDAEWVTDKETYIRAQLDVDGSGYTESSEGLLLNVKGRGNSTWSLPKKPMRLKFDKKTSICGFDKAKSYVLLADYSDQSLMRNATALWVAQKLGISSAVDFMPCQVWVNGKFAGMYLLTDKIGINKTSVDIDESAGVLIEMSNEYDEPYKFRSAIHKLPVMIKDPDFDELAVDYPDGPSPDERLATWETDFNKAEAVAEQAGDAFEAGRQLAPGEGEVEKYFDMNSAVDYILLYNFARNNEIGFPKSCYLYKEAPGEDFKYKIGPAWDFDISFNILSYGGKPDATEAPINKTVWLNSLLYCISCSPKFLPLYKERFEYFKSTIYPELLEWIDSYSSLIEPGARLDGLRWPETFDNPQWIKKPRSAFDNRLNVAELKDWIMRRVDAMQQAVDEGRF
ncbi:MAG: CotH kinase family protein [Duncaniella sp.]|nr:CotH kinase family protein [Duncaniella sp.]